MKELISSWPLAFRYLLKDPVNFLFFMIPTVLALLVYIMLGGVILPSGMSWAEVMISKYIISKNAGLILYYIVSGLLFFLFFMLINWTFVMCLGILASPFNEMISRRIEQQMTGVKLADKAEGWRQLVSGLGRTFKNEIKKILLIVLFTALAAFLNFIPVLYPVAIILLSLLMSAQFLDYTWSRHELKASDCSKYILRYLPTHVLSGAMFLVLVAVPLLNVLVPALATSYYTVLWIQRQKSL